MAPHVVGQPGKPQGLTRPSTPRVAQKSMLCAADEGLAVTPPTHHCSTAPFIHARRLDAISGMCTRPAYKVSIYRPWGTCSFSLLGD